MNSEKIGVSELTIEGPSREECIAALHRTYGIDYQITGQKVILKGGFMGLFQHEVIRISYIPTTRNSMTESRQPEDDKDTFRRNRDDFLKKADPSVTSNLQIAQIAKKLDMISDQMNQKLETITQASTVHDEHPTIKKIQDLLTENEFTPSYIQKMSDRIRTQFSLEELDDFDKIQAAVVDWIGEDIHISKDVAFRPPHVIIIVGPTGVGKTTTIAKMAANIILDAKNRELPKPSILLVTVDSIRVGAEVQLERYGSIMGAMVNKAEKVDAVKALFEENKADLDYMLIDTSGSSPNDFENIGKMRAVLEVPGLHPDVYLAITAGTKAKDLEKILKSYEPFNFRSVIITKCDETTSYGNVLSVLAENGKEISWITDGQIVPKYIERATPIRFLINLSDFNVDRKHIEEKFNSRSK